MIKRNTNYLTPYFYRGNLFYDLKRYPETIKDFSQVIKFNPKHSVAYVKRGMAR